MIRSVRVLILLGAITLFGSPTPSLAGFYTFAGERFALCTANELCDGQEGCFDQVGVGPGANCFAGCVNSMAGGQFDCRNQSNYNASMQRVIGVKAVVEDDFYDPDAYIDLSYVNLGSGVLELDITYAVGTNGRLEASVFRFDGDPSVFEPLKPESVSDLVDLGILAPTDVLWSMTFPETGGSLVLLLDQQVDPGQVPSDELVIFVTGDGPNECSFGNCSPSDVPALSKIYAGLLAVVIALLATVFLVRRSTRLGTV